MFEAAGVVGVDVGKVEELREWSLLVCKLVEKAEAGGMYPAPDFRQRRVDLNSGGYHCIERDLCFSICHGEWMHDIDARYGVFGTPPTRTNELDLIARLNAYGSLH